jgi:hypothetical protein
LRTPRRGRPTSFAVAVPTLAIRKSLFQARESPLGDPRSHRDEMLEGSLPNFTIPVNRGRRNWKNETWVSAPVSHTWVSRRRSQWPCSTRKLRAASFSKNCVSPPCLAGFLCSRQFLVSPTVHMLPDHDEQPLQRGSCLSFSDRLAKRRLGLGGWICSGVTIKPSRSRVVSSGKSMRPTRREMRG